MVKQSFTADEDDAAVVSFLEAIAVAFTADTLSDVGPAVSILLR